MNRGSLLILQLAKLLMVKKTFLFLLILLKILSASATAPPQEFKYLINNQAYSIPFKWVKNEHGYPEFKTTYKTGDTVLCENISKQYDIAPIDESGSTLDRNDDANYKPLILEYIDISYYGDYCVLEKFKSHDTLFLKNVFASNDIVIPQIVKQLNVSTIIVDESVISNIQTYTNEESSKASTIIFRKSHVWTADFNGLTKAKLILFEQTYCQSMIMTSINFEGLFSYSYAPCYYCVDSFCKNEDLGYQFFQLSSTTFNGGFYYSNQNPKSYIQLQGASINNAFFNKGPIVNWARPHPLYNAYFEDTKFSGVTSFNDLRLVNCNFSNTYFQGKVQLLNTILETDTTIEINRYLNNDFETTFYKVIFLGKEVDLLINPKNFNINSFKFSSEALTKIYFMPVYPDWLKDMGYIDQNHKFYSVLSDYVYRNQLGNSVLTNTLISKLESEKKQSDLNFYAFNLFANLRFCANYLWLGFLQVVVGLGYDGELNFFLTALVSVGTFSLLFFVFYKEGIICYLNQKHTVANAGLEQFNDLQIFPAKSDFRTFARCFWFSAQVFINPLFNFSLFNFKKNRLFVCVLIEWIWGLFLIVLFWVYIASNYSFIAKIFGI